MPLPLVKLSRARANLSQVGKELFIEATVDQLILRTLNDAKSAFAAFYFNDSGGFFESFRRARRPDSMIHLPLLIDAVCLFETPSVRSVVHVEQVE